MCLQIRGVQVGTVTGVDHTLEKVRLLPCRGALAPSTSTGMLLMTAGAVGSPLLPSSTVHEHCKLHGRQGWLLLHADLLMAHPCRLHHTVTAAAGQCAGGQSPCCRSMRRGSGPLLQTLSRASSNTLHAQRPTSLLQVNVQVEIKDDKTAIPRNSLIEANQSGLIAESLIDITPQQPIPQYKVGARPGAAPGRCQKQRPSLRLSCSKAQRCACLPRILILACRLLRAAH